MKQQQSPPICVAMGANSTWCGVGQDDYKLSDNFHIDTDLAQFLEAAKEAKKLKGVVSPISIIFILRNI
jgi:hypothetical protein